MPYIKQDRRNDIDYFLKFPANTPGELNYVLTRIIMEYLPKNYKYEDLNAVWGVIGLVQSEFWRRVIVPYEKEKEKENGDVY